MCADSSARIGGPLFVAAASGDRVDVETAAKYNVLILHDFKHMTTFATDDQPVLCASCHRSNALAEVGGPGGIPEGVVATPEISPGKKRGALQPLFSVELTQNRKQMWAPNL